MRNSLQVLPAQRPAVLTHQAPLPPAAPQDIDGVIGVFSGPSLPGNLSTAGGYLRLTFATDATVHGGGWALAYNATPLTKAPLPACAPGERVAQAAVRARSGGSEMSWTVTRRCARFVCCECVVPSHCWSPEAAHAWQCT